MPIKMRNCSFPEIIMRHLSSWIYQTLGISPEMQQSIIVSAIVIFVLLMVRVLLLRIITRRTEDKILFYQWRRAVAYMVGFAGVLALGWVWLKGFESVTTFVGLCTVGLCIAMREVILNMAGWIFILYRKPFEVGHRIQAGESAGDVIELGLFEFSLMEIRGRADGEQITGRVLHIPNSIVFTGNIANYSKGLDYIWNEMSVTITFESDWEKAREILKQIVRQNAEQAIKTAEPQVKTASRKLMIYYTNLKSEVYTAVRGHGIELTMRFVCQPRERRTIEQDIWEDVLRQFAKCDDIEFAYPTQRFYNSTIESKTISRQLQAHGV
jgi:small-conductance mechanosensitive channel